MRVGINSNKIMIEKVKNTPKTLAKTEIVSAITLPQNFIEKLLERDDFIEDVLECEDFDDYNDVVSHYVNNLDDYMLLIQIPLTGMQAHFSVQIHSS